MLDNITKRRIDDCRDILVGKLPDPKSQIEQITIALIYKFMDDMDKEAIALGGKAKFFSDYTLPDPNAPNKTLLVPFEKYSWGNLFDAKVSATQMLKLYSEAIEGMVKNPNIPELFATIFKNAYLPYRDPETLKMFLKTIGEFEYTHSEKLGDAFEYLLSVMGSQGDAGQFRTPRHIIDFLVAAVDPNKNDTILDPACGTAGFLISAFKYISNNGTNAMHGVSNNELQPDERKKIIKNLIGYDISPDMVRMSLVNLYLHGFSDPHIFEYDTLSSEDRWDETFDVVLANPPFMSPKGGIRPHKKFSITSNRSEVLFVDYIAEHLNPNGKAGIIVPEGIIFQSGKAYKELRKMLVDNYLYAVVSLPAGVFNPYSGVKTSILLMDKALAKKTNDILFVKIENDGYSLGAQRTPIKGGQLEEVIQTLTDYKNHIINSQPFENTTLAHAVSKEAIGKSGDYNLSGDKYKIISLTSSKYDLVKLEDICDRLFAGGDAPNEFSKTQTINFNIPIYSNGIGKKSIYGYSNISKVDEDAVTISARGTIGHARVRKAPFLPIVRLIVAIPNKTKVNINYLQLLLDSLDIYRNGNSIPQLTIPMIKNEKIPLPPLSVQEEIVAEIESYQKIIDGAKMVVDHYKPRIEIDPKWEMEQLDKIIKLSSGKGLTSINMVEGPYPVYGGNGINGYHNEYFLEEPTIVIGRVGAYCGVVHITENKSWISDNGLYVTNFLQEIELKYLSQVLTQLNLNQFAKVGGQPSISQKTVTDLKIPVPSLETQQQIVSQIEKEQALVNANKELIAIYEQKIKDRIAKVWGE
ncbi:N-6 DNA methylase [Flavobacterium sp. NRK F10]|uniref:N-6 DNA methylase n=1 Tax=Flavobacterium sp. NRK F10 TaxID=2954931 RepID=UPI0020914BBC|nr:N-6 DNA methylase [Flavobacterium sp. NRK F10]MCO6173596.1 N-6 DNA methylase [Flavobacterium sp. NRK F10]